VFPKGQYQDLRAAGIESLRQSIAQIEPHLAEHVQTLTDWHQLTLLSVESSRCPRWYKPGLLLIGDAAHTMSPVGGVGINYAVQDAVEATNILAAPLRDGRLQVDDLAKVQKQREWPTRVIQAMQSTVQDRVLASALRSQTAPSIPWFVRAFFATPVVRDIPARILAFGVRRVRLKEGGANGSH
jgi:2-polyprenyl-6-methoxyphenol hydroxylase-like FAD-dependent oxidoreductase